MIPLLGAVGWGLLACGAITHVWHQQRLRDLLAMHMDYERLPAAALTIAEVAIFLALPVLLLQESQAVVWVALAGLVLAVGFMAWIARLLLSNSELPCACSFSGRPTTSWSLGRSVFVGLVGLFAVVDRGDIDAAQTLATLAVGWAIGAAIFVIPEALSWPDASKAVLARVDAHAETAPATT